MLCHHFFTFGTSRSVAIPHGSAELSHGISRLRPVKKVACVFPVGGGLSCDSENLLHMTWSKN